MVNVKLALGGCYEIGNDDIDYYYQHFDSLAMICKDWRSMLSEIPCDFVKMNNDYWYVKNHFDSLKTACYNMIAEAQRKALEAQKLQEYVKEYFSVDKLGIYNCDQITRLTEPVTITAGYTNEKGDALRLVKIQLVDRQINAILEYNGYNGLSPYKFAYGKHADSMLLGYDADLNAYYCENDEFSRISGLYHIFLMKPVPKLKDRKALEALVK